MRLTFAEERWNDIVEELKPLFVLHFSEAVLRHPRYALAPNYEHYETLDGAGILSLTTARAAGELVGYFLNYITTSPHYRNTLHSVMDTFFLAPAHRNAQNGLRLFAAMEKIVRARGAEELLANTKTGYDVSALFKLLGWHPVAATFAKSLGEN